VPFRPGSHRDVHAPKLINSTTVESKFDESPWSGVAQGLWSRQSLMALRNEPMKWRQSTGSGWPRSPLGSEIGSTMSYSAFGSLTLKSIAGLVLLAAGAVGTHSSDAGATRSSHQIVESLDCRGDREVGGHRNRGHFGHNGGGHSPGFGLQQTISVSVPATTFLRVDKSGGVTSAATNTGCQPSSQDDVFLLRPNGAIEPATLLDVHECDWTGDFTVPGRFQTQRCTR
jgi:hypothetical protein